MDKPIANSFLRSSANRTEQFGFMRGQQSRKPKCKGHISIIITSYNYDKYIEECILSCIGQARFDDYEIIVVDDGSTDGSLDIIARYSEYLTLIKTVHKGLERAANAGVACAKGRYIMRVDADDIIYPECLFLLAKEVERERCAFVYGEYDEINGKSRIIRRVRLPNFDAREIACRGDFLATGTLYRADCLKEVGCYNVKVKNCGLENYELVLALLNRQYFGKCVHKPLFAYRRHGSNISTLNHKKIVAYGQRLFKKFNLGKYKTNSNHPYGLQL